MKFKELNPRWIGSGGEGISRLNSEGVREPVPFRDEIGIVFSCPCGCDNECFIYVDNHPDGQPIDSGGSPVWQCADRDFETFTLSPSIKRNKIREDHGCEWHGFIKNGLIEHCSDARNEKGEPVR